MEAALASLHSPQVIESKGLSGPSGGSKKSSDPPFRLYFEILKVEMSLPIALNASFRAVPFAGW
jgi:hypothetical protein